MANVDTHEEFWGITLSGDKKTHIWNPADAEEEIEHKVQVTQACLGQKAKDGERNVIEVSTEDDNGKKISCSVVSLRVGFNECMHLELGFTNPVKFVLKEGSGPISLCGVHLMALPLDLNNVDGDDSSEDEDEDVPQVLEVVGTKANIEELPQEKMDTEEIIVKTSEPEKIEVPVEDTNTKKSDGKEVGEKPKEKVVEENAEKEVHVKKSKKRALSEEKEVVSSKKKKEEKEEVKEEEVKVKEEGKKKVEKSVAVKGEEEEEDDDDDLEDADSEDGDEESDDEDEDDDQEGDDTDDDDDNEDIDIGQILGEDSDDMDSDEEGSDEEEEESEDEKPKKKQQTKVNGNLAPAKKQETKVNGKEKGKQTKPSANKENVNNNNNSNDKNATPKGKKNKETPKKDTAGTPHKRTPEEIKSLLLKSPNLPKKYEKFANYMKNNMKVTDAKTQKELWDYVQKNKK